LALAGALAAASSFDAITLPTARRLRGAVLVALAVWGVASLAQLPPLDADAPVPERASGPLVALAIAGIALYAIAVVRYAALARGPPAGLRVVMASAWALPAGAMLPSAVARDCYAAGWGWRGLMLAAVRLAPWAARGRWHEERVADVYRDE